MMLKNPRLKYCYHAEFLDEERVLLLSEKKNTLLSGKLYNLVLSHIQQDGISTEELVARLEGQVSAPEVLYALNILQKEGYITEAIPSVSSELCAYWNSMGIDVKILLQIFEEKPTSVESIGALPIEAFLQVFETSGIKTSPKGVLKVFITDDYERKELWEINQEAMAARQHWMLIKPVGVEVWIGPIFVPDKTGCWGCLTQRLRNNRPMNIFYKNQRNTEENPPVPVSHAPMSFQVAANLSAIEIAKWLYFGKNERLEGRIVSLDTLSCVMKSHVLVKRPQCEVCGEDEYRNIQPRPIVLRKKSSYCLSKQGGYREVAFEDTVAKYQHHVSPITGVVQTLEPYFPEHGSPVHNYVSGYNVALKSKTLLWLNHHLRGSNVGKGKTWSQAKAGALCEAIERYSCTYQGDEAYISSSLQELGVEGIHPNACMNYSEKQYQHRAQINKDCSKFYFMVPVPFDESCKMHWTPVYSLTEHRFKYLPSCFCYNQYPAENELHLFCYPDTNGNAAGNSIEEAILHGFLELVERDSVALWWYNMLRKPAVDLSSFQKPYFIQLIEYYASLNRSLYVLDLTTDLQIPSFAALSFRIDNNKQDIIFAFGAHIEAKIGIERALIELNQLLPIINVPEANGAAGKYRTEDQHFLDWLNTATIENQPYLKPLENVPRKKASDYPALCPPNVYDSVMFCVERAKKHGLETLVLDMTRPDVELNVVKVIVPGLRHFWKRLAPGRLYDVPVKMGWLKTPLKEEELNPIGIFI
jgi:bacteriocin biosynthesis cyclodehydratase domain-containing protein